MENREALLLEPGKIQVFTCEKQVIQDEEFLVKME